MATNTTVESSTCTTQTTTRSTTSSSDEDVAIKVGGASKYKDVFADGLSPVVIPRTASEWGEINVPMWKKFGIELELSVSTLSSDRPETYFHTILHMIGKLEKAAQSCGIPLELDQKAKMVWQRMDSVMLALGKNMSWYDMSQQERKETLLTCEWNSMDKKLDSLSREAWCLLETVADGLLYVTNPGAGRVTKEPLPKESQIPCTHVQESNRLKIAEETPESDYENLASNMIGNFFGRHVRRKEAQYAYLYALDPDTAGQRVSCDPDILCASRLLLKNDLTHGHLSFVVEVKRDDLIHRKKAASTDSESYLSTLNQHFAQLLICSRDSLFSKNWKECTDELNIPTMENIAVFGAMIHGTKLHLTCLEISAKHLSKIHRREQKPHFSPKVCIRNVSDDEVVCEYETSLKGDDESRSDSRKQQAKKKKSSEERSRSTSTIDPADIDGVFSVSKPFMIDNIFNLSGTDWSEYRDFVRFLETLQCYASHNETIKKYSLRIINFV